MEETKNMGQTVFRDVNEVYLSGKIVAIRPGRIAGPYGPIKFIRVTLTTRTLPHFFKKDQPTTEVRDFPTVYWYAERAAEAERFQVGDNVTITAFTKLTKNMDKTTNEFRFYQDLIGTKIEPTLRQLDEAFGLNTNLGQYCRDENEVLISGTIIQRYKAGDYRTILSIRSDLEDQSVMSDVHCTNKNRVIIQKISDGAHVCLVGKVETQETTIDGKKKMRQRIVCHDIAEA